MELKSKLYIFLKQEITILYVLSEKLDWYTSKSCLLSQKLNWLNTKMDIVILV